MRYFPEDLEFGRNTINVSIDFILGSDEGSIDSDTVESIITECLNEDIGINVRRDLAKWYGIYFDDSNINNYVTNFSYDLDSSHGNIQYEFDILVSDEHADEDGLPPIETVDGLETVFKKWLDYNGDVYIDDDTYYLEYTNVDLNRIV